MAVMPLKLEAACSQLHRGGVIAYPTEGVWGIGCDPFNRHAVERLLAIKGRSLHKGLILVAASIDQFSPFLVGLDSGQRATLGASWPGPNTWLVPDNGTAPAWIRGAHDSVALRVTDHPLVAELCRCFGGPIVSTSANPAGRPVARYAWQIRRQLPQLDYLLHGALGRARGPSQIRDLVTGAIVRGA